MNFKMFTSILLITGSPENSGGSSFWNYGRTAMDYTHVLKKYVYQLASRSSHSLTTTNNDNDQPNSFSGEDVSLRFVKIVHLIIFIDQALAFCQCKQICNIDVGIFSACWYWILFSFFQVWTKRGVTEDDLFLWVERLRKVRKINTCTLYVYKCLKGAIYYEHRLKILIFEKLKKKTTKFWMLLCSMII